MSTRRFGPWLLILFLSLPGCAKKAPQFGLSIRDHDLSVTLFPSEHRLDAIDRMTVDIKSDEIRFLLNENLEVKAIRAGGQNCDFRIERDFDPEVTLAEPYREDSAWVQRAALVVAALPKLEKKPEKIEVEYGGIVFDSTGQAEFSRGYVAGQTSGIISVRGVYLAPSSIWYPTVPGDLSSVRVSVRSPVPYEAVSQGAMVQRKVQGEWIQTVWDERQPQDGVYLSAGKWRITQLPLLKYSVMTYFTQETASIPGMEKNYLQACARYLSMYERLLGPYPYAKFAVVENFYPTGYGMPSFTLLGSEVIRLPFIIRTSLGHEVCHNWWGNSVYVRPGAGNWCEGLTTYCADYYYAERQGEEAAAHYRMGINRDYLSYVTPENDFPLREFKERTDPASRAVGYGKAAMVFHQMRLLLGDDKFWNALRNVYANYRFQYVSWDDFQKVFEEFHGDKLDWFFRQWLDRTGAPVLKLESVRKSQRGDRFAVTVSVRQEGPELYRLRVPVRVQTTAGSEDVVLDLSSEVDSVTVEVVNRPVLAEVDPGFDVFRRLLPGEYPPALSQLLGETRPKFLLSPGESNDFARAYSQVATAIGRGRTGSLEEATNVAPESLAVGSFCIFGNPALSPVWEDLRKQIPPGVRVEGTSITLAGTEYSLSVPGLAVVLVLQSPYNPDEAAVVIWGGSPEAIVAIADKLQHYGKYSYLVFERGRSIAQGEWRVGQTPLAQTL